MANSLGQSSFSMLHTDQNHDFEGQQKIPYCPTTQGKESQVSNLPFFKEGIFWNTNHLLQAQALAFSQADPIFEGEILRNHLQVVKFTLHNYSANEEMVDKEDTQAHSLFEQVEFILLKDTSKFVDPFLSELQNSSYFQQNQIKVLKAILQKCSRQLSLFQVFGEASPSRGVGQLYYLVGKGLILNEELRKSGRIEIQKLPLYIEDNLGSILQSCGDQKEEQKFKKMAQIILYTTVMCASGYSFNQYYDSFASSQEPSSKLVVTKFEKYLNSITKDRAKKVKILRRPGKREDIMIQKKQGSL